MRAFRQSRATGSAIYAADVQPTSRQRVGGYAATAPLVPVSGSIAISTHCLVGLLGSRSEGTPRVAVSASSPTGRVTHRLDDADEASSGE